LPAFSIRRRFTNGFMSRQEIPKSSNPRKEAGFAPGVISALFLCDPPSLGGSLGRLMDDTLLLALAEDANSVPLPARRVAAAAGAVRHINRCVGDAALQRIGIGRATETFDTLRAQYAAKSEIARE
jgi:hypothetical protein